MPSTAYEYNGGSSYDYELKKITTSFGGTAEYSYANHNFFFNGIPLDSRVLVQKKITFAANEEGTWNYVYPDYNGVTTGTVHIQGPEFNTEVTYNAYDSNAPWKIGTLSALQREDGSYSNTVSWSSQQISSATWSVLGTNMGTVKGVLPSTDVEGSLGDATLKTEYLYEGEPGLYGLPTKILHYVNASQVPKYYESLEYGLQSSSFLLALRTRETLRKGDNDALLADRLISYYNESGKWGVTRQVSILKQGSTYCNWTYTYTPSDPQGKTIEIRVEKPSGLIDKQTYSYGIQKEGNVGDIFLLTREISEYDSMVKSEIQNNGPKITFHHDALGRTTAVDMPGRNGKATIWNQNNAVTTQGVGRSIVEYWDGMGRNTGYTETGGGITLYYRKWLDSEGRTIADNIGSIDPNLKTSYTYNAAGKVITATDPDGNTTSFAYTPQTTVKTDAESHITTLIYDDLPGLPTSVIDALGNTADYTYDGLGRLVAVDLNNGARSHSYQYDFAGNLSSEAHPETGVITYTYDDDNRLIEKAWGGSVIRNYYNGANGTLFKVTSGNGTAVDEEIGFAYIDGRLHEVISSNGWKRWPIYYDGYGNVTSETISLPGLSPKTINYEYDLNNNLKKIIYPDGSWAETPSNGLNRPQSLTFNGNTLISTASYGPGKAIAGLTFARNGTQLSSTFYSSGSVNSVSLAGGGSALYQASYTYDGVGNIKTISSSAPVPPMNATFGYDSLNRLTAAIYSSGRVANYAYGYDSYGNLESVIENETNVAFDEDYDNHNRIVGEDYDPRGNLLSASGNILSWSKVNSLESVRTMGGEVLGRYLYDERGLRIVAIPPFPDIQVRYEGDLLSSGGEALIDCEVGQHVDKTFTVENIGEGRLSLSGSPVLAIGGSNADQFSVQQQPTSPILPAGSTTFIIRFHPTSVGTKVAAISIATNDPDENPYDIALIGNPSPEINIPEVADGESWDFGTVTIPESVDATFTIQNLGKGDLALSGSPRVRITGDPYHQFVVVQQPAAMVPPNESTTFVVRYVALRVGQSYAQLTIINNDQDENPYNFTLAGYGVRDGRAKAGNDFLDIISPKGGEKIIAGSTHAIKWTGGDANHDMKIEYSTDNGSSYKTIVDKTPNTGIYNWSVPAEISPMCLIRISDPAGKALALRTLTFGFNIKAEPPSDQTGANAQLGFHASLPISDAQVSLVADLTIIYDSQSLKEKTNFNLSESELRERHIYSGDWHSIQIRFNIDELSGTLLVDGLTILEGVPLIKLPIETNVPELALLRDAATSSKVWLDDTEINLQDKTMAPDEGMVIYKPIVRDLFDAYKTGDFPGLGGWLVRGTQTSIVESETNRVLDGKAGDNLQALGILLAAVDDSECLSPRKALELKQKAQDSAQVNKRVSLPVTIPFDVSLTSFAIASGTEELEDISTELNGDEAHLDESSTSGNDLRSTGTNPSISEVKSDNEIDRQRLASRTATLSDPRVGCYYIYTFDGRPLAEYDIFGNCLKDYIYMGGRLVAEYDPAVQQYFYYTPDHIGSTRVVTNDAGVVVYAEAHDPYGGIQQTWPDSFNPTPEFSGKERDDESMMDYFGARYYSSPNYRWVSVDPALSKDKAIMNPQLWNLYSFCANNPVTVTDPNGDSIYGDEEAYRLIQEIFGSYGWMLTRDADGHIRFIHSISDEDINQLAINHPELQELILAILDTSYKIKFQTDGEISTSEGDVPVTGPDDIAVKNDWRKIVKLPPDGYAGVAAINEAIAVGDPNDVNKNVSARALAYHVLLEVIGHVAFGMQAYPVPGASVRTYQRYSHYWAGAHEMLMLATWHDFTAYPAGSGPDGVFHNKEPKRR